jgi:glucokinase
MNCNILAADISGTNTTFAIVNINDKKIKIITKKKYLTKNIKNISKLINDFLINNDNITKATFAIAGPISNDIVKLTNQNLTINKKEILKKTKIKDLLLINDFEAIGYAINDLNQNDKLLIKKGKIIKNKTKAVIGAGTGLGKSILYYDKQTNFYIPIKSEGGHRDFSIENLEELKIIEFLKKKRKKTIITEEDIISGNGIELLYQYFKETKFKTNKIPNKLTANKISESINANKCSKKTFDYFIKFYAKCAKNFALETFSLSGIYIAGGIFTKNTKLFNQNFTKEFIKNDDYKQILKNIPIIGIKNYEISLKGAGFAFLINKKQK